ncbi:MAG: hypothetical protein HC849_00520 [Oscillatoriales cyanobacterium RU_3_3]|nr:hypothetical protein [Microcoleus sp. SU_5_3]NJL65834.1 hypothetical protein [Microcoleus sp. SM1_3_4]NJM59016.1 hypothetical protein [Oscillatoriales cyanobacterium RU_3_3]
MPVSSLILYSLPTDLLLQIPASRSLAIYSRSLRTYYCKFLRRDRSLFTVDRYRVGNCKSQGINRHSSEWQSFINLGRSSWQLSFVKV